MEHAPTASAKGLPHDLSAPLQLARPPRRHRLRAGQPAVRHLLHGRQRAPDRIAVGDLVLDLAAASGDAAHATGSLNAFLAQGPLAWQQQRARLRTWLTDDAHRSDVEPHLLPRADVRLHLPVEVADYVDFSSSQRHAENVGRMFRPDSPPLTPNWKHLPIGYHGRAGTVQVSGTPVVRPSGQRKAPTDEVPTPPRLTGRPPSSWPT